MSFKAIQWALEQQDLHSAEKFILVVLAFRDAHDEPHGCWPSINRMAQDCGVDRRTVMRSLNRLVRQGKIKRESRKHPDGTDSTNYYTFPQVWVGAPCPPVVAQRPWGRGIRSKRVGAPCPPNLKKETVKEPSRSALSLPPDEQRRFQDNFLAEMKRIAQGKAS